MLQGLGGCWYDSKVARSWQGEEMNVGTKVCILHCEVYIFERIWCWGIKGSEEGEKEKIEGKERENTKKNKKCSYLKEPKYRGICEERREKREKRERVRRGEG